MHILIEATSGDARIALLDAVDASILSRSGEAVPAWFRERSQHRLTARNDGAPGFEVRFPDAGALAAFVGRFLPGQIERARAAA